MHRKVNQLIIDFSSPSGELRTVEQTDLTQF